MIKARRKFIVGLVAFLALLLPCTVSAQSLSDYELQLSLSSYESGYSLERNFSAYPGEENPLFSNYITNVLGSEDLTAINISENMESIEIEEVEVEDIVSTKIPSITINNSYESRILNAQEEADSSFAIKSDRGRWKIYGSFEQKYFTQVDDKIYQDRSQGQSFLRGAARTSKDDAADELKTSVSSSYYLEAVYSFKPTVKGRVALKHSQIDTFDTEKTIQFEGIVEPKPNVQIKAGFDNELGAESNAENKGAKDTRVWTEFILKF